LHTYKKTPRQGTPHKASRSVPDDEESCGGDKTVTFSPIDVLDDEAIRVSNHHRHAGEPIESGEGIEDNAAEDEGRKSISLADYVPALNEQPLPETMKISEGFFDDILGPRDSADQSDIVKASTTKDDDWKSTESFIHRNYSRLSW
jgi:hypothetical protein